MSVFKLMRIVLLLSIFFVILFGTWLTEKRMAASIFQDHKLRNARHVARGPASSTLRLRSLLGVFIAAVLYFVAVYHLTNLYITEHHGFERFILLDGGVYTSLFWVVQIALGSLLPLALLYLPATGQSRSWISVASLLVIIGGLGSIEGVILGGIAFAGLPEILREAENYRIVAFGALLVAMGILMASGHFAALTRALAGMGQLINLELQ